jgi:hypothetical protein
MATYPATFDAVQPPTLSRAHIGLRVVIIIVLSFLAGILGWLQGIVYLGIPVLAAILISQKGPETYLAEAEQGMAKWLRLLVGFYAYMILLTDKLPTDDADTGVRFEVRPTGTPSIGSALLRIITAIPHAFVLGLLGIVAFILVIVGAIVVLIQETVPEGIYSFLRGYMRWWARVLAYMGSLTDEYPPFALDTGQEGAAAAQLPEAPQAPQPPASV